MLPYGEFKMPQNNRHFRNIFILLGVLASGCSSTNDKTTVAAPPQPTSAPVAITAVPYQEAVRKAAQDLLANAKLPGEESSIVEEHSKLLYTLNALCIEMDNRYQLLKDAGARNIKEYNKKIIDSKLSL